MNFVVQADHGVELKENEKKVKYLILPRPRIGMLSLLTMLTWNRRDSTPLSAAPRAPKIAVSNPTQAGQRFTWSKYGAIDNNYGRQ